MAFTTLLIAASLVALASTGFPGWPDNDNLFPGFPPAMTVRFGDPSPTMPGMAKFPFMPSLFFNQFAAFPTMRPIKFPKLPSAADIASAIPSNGGAFNGVMVSTQSESKTNEDGKVVKKGGSTIVINDNGKVTVQKTGESPPEIVTNASPEQNNKTQSSEFDDPKINPFKPFKFKPFPTIKPIDPDEIKNYVPKKGEHFIGHHVSSHSSFQEVNGKKKEESSVISVFNNNGKVKEDHFGYHNED